MPDGERLELPGGGWAQLRDPEAVTERQRKPFVTALGRASKYEQMDDGGLGAMIDVQDALVVALVDSWSYEAPVSADALLDLPHKAVTALRVACLAHQSELMPDFGPTPDPATPSVPSNA